MFPSQMWFSYKCVQLLLGSPYFSMQLYYPPPHPIPSHPIWAEEFGKFANCVSRINLAWLLWRKVHQSSVCFWISPSPHGSPSSLSACVSQAVPAWYWRVCTAVLFYILKKKREHATGYLPFFKPGPWHHRLSCFTVSLLQGARGSQQSTLSRVWEQSSRGRGKRTPRRTLVLHWQTVHVVFCNVHIWIRRCLLMLFFFFSFLFYLLVFSPAWLHCDLKPPGHSWKRFFVSKKDKQTSGSTACHLHWTGFTVK